MRILNNRDARRLGNQVRRLRRILQRLHSRGRGHISGRVIQRGKFAELAEEVTKIKESDFYRKP